MFEVGDYIVYGKNGVCKVADIGTVDMAGFTRDKSYYTLIPLYSKGSKVFIPTDNDKLIMRPVISKTDALELIDDINNIETLAITDDKRSEELYKESMKKCDCREWIKIIKTLYLRNQSRIADGKKVTASDEKYLHDAQEFLYEELAIPLKMNKDNVKDFIIARVERSETRLN